MKKLYTPTYKSYLSSMKRARNEAVLLWLKKMFRKAHSIPYREDY